MARTTNWPSLSDADLLQQLDEAKEDLFKLRFQIVTGRLTNNARLKEAKKEVARAMTELRMREIRAAEDLQNQLTNTTSTTDAQEAG